MLYTSKHFTVFSLNFEGDNYCPLGRFFKGQFQLQCGIGAMVRPGSNPAAGALNLVKYNVLSILKI